MIGIGPGFGLAVAILPIIALAILGATVLGTILLNRKFKPYGWLLPIAVIGLLFLSYERMRNGEFFPRSKGTVEFRIGQRTENILNNSTYHFPSIGDGRLIYTGDVVDVRFHHNGKIISFPRVGGLSGSLLLLGIGDDGRINFVEFGAQHRPLTLDQVLTRGQQIEAQLKSIGLDVNLDGSNPGNFRVLDAPDRAGEFQFHTWEDAESALAIEENAIEEIRLLSLKDKDICFYLTARNWRRAGGTIFEHNFGREWGIEIAISSREFSEC